MKGHGVYGASWTSRSRHRKATQLLHQPNDAQCRHFRAVVVVVEVPPTRHHVTAPAAADWLAVVAVGGAYVHLVLSPEQTCQANHRKRVVQATSVGLNLNCRHRATGAEPVVDAGAADGGDEEMMPDGGSSTEQGLSEVQVYHGRSRRSLDRRTP